MAPRGKMRSHTLMLSRAGGAPFERRKDDLQLAGLAGQMLALDVRYAKHDLEDTERFNLIALDIKSLQGQHVALATKIDENTAMTKCIQKNTSDMIETWKTVTAGLRVLANLAKVAKYIGYVAGAIAAVLALFHFGNGKPPQS